jgi:hypothetical protein
MAKQLSQAEQMNIALAKTTKLGFPGLAGSKGYPKSGATPNSPQFKPVVKSKPKVLGKPAVKVANKKASPKPLYPNTPKGAGFKANDAIQQAVNRAKVQSSVRKSMGYTP